MPTEEPWHPTFIANTKLYASTPTVDSDVRAAWFFRVPHYRPADSSTTHRNTERAQRAAKAMATKEAHRAAEANAAEDPCRAPEAKAAKETRRVAKAKTIEEGRRVAKAEINEEVRSAAAIHRGKGPKVMTALQAGTIDNLRLIEGIAAKPRTRAASQKRTPPKIGAR